MCLCGGQVWSASLCDLLVDVMCVLSMCGGAKPKPSAMPRLEASVNDLSAV